MTRAFRARVPAAAVAALAAIGLASGPAAASSSSAGTVRAACGAVKPPMVRCLAQYVVPGTVAPATANSPRPVTPKDLQAAYGVPPAAGAGATVAVVDAADDPKAESDLAAFRSRYGLPRCTTANGCFRKVNQDGDRAPLPSRDSGWGLEISLDLDAVSAICPACSILLVESRSPTVESLGAAVNTAVRLGADVVSNSYGTDEFTGIKAYGRRYYRHPGVPLVVASGDFGFGAAQFPAVLQTVIAVGGTKLVRDTGTARGWRETAWSGSGSGCSAYIAKPAWQHDGHCLMRTTADVSADAAPATGLVVSDSFGYPGQVRVGGTSLSAPLVAAMYAMAGNTRSIANAARLYTAAPNTHHDIVTGSNGFCGKDYLCTARPGYDAPTGVGSPHGLRAF